MGGIMRDRFPDGEYYGADLIDGATVRRDGAWWSAVLLIRDPQRDEPYVALHRWAKRNGAWQRSGTYRFSSREQIADAVRVLTEYAEKM